MGIEKQEQYEIFKPFYTGKSESNQYLNPCGRGLGLSICQSIAQKMRGKISFTSDPNYSTCFKFMIKLERISVVHYGKLELN